MRIIALFFMLPLAAIAEPLAEYSITTGFVKQAGDSATLTASPGHAITNVSPATLEFLRKTQNAIFTNGTVRAATAAELHAEKSRSADEALNDPRFMFEVLFQLRRQSSNTITRAQFKAELVTIYRQTIPP